jgi:hypothetical protein
MQSRIALRDQDLFLVQKIQVGVTAGLTLASNFGFCFQYQAVQA